MLISDEYMTQSFPHRYGLFFGQHPPGTKSMAEKMKTNPMIFTFCLRVKIFGLMSMFYQKMKFAWFMAFDDLTLELSLPVSLKYRYSRNIRNLMSIHMVLSFLPPQEGQCFLFAPTTIFKIQCNFFFLMFLIISHLTFQQFFTVLYDGDDRQIIRTLGCLYSC